jgi:hypothetical protein
MKDSRLSIAGRPSYEGLPLNEFLQILAGGRARDSGLR